MAKSGDPSPKAPKQKAEAAETRKTLPIIRVRQWLSSWNEVPYAPDKELGRPEGHFWLMSVKARHLKALTGVYRRSIKQGKPRALDPNVQRGHEEQRSTLIKEYVQFGFPWCEMTEARRKLSGAKDLKKPGWLPTAVIVNVLAKGAERNGVVIPEEDLINIESDGEVERLALPKGFKDADWTPKQVFPLEVIDGQHRLWAFEDFDPGDEFELPVVAFQGLERGWQAYLFWSVNITPKKINRSLAFDLYPLLRQQSWLDKFAGHSIYRETRAQELVEAMWSNESSPWRYRINMLGEKAADREYKGPMVSQAAWIRSLLSSFVKQSEGAGTTIGGLFGAPAGEHRLHLPWNRPMQAAFLIMAGRHLKEAIASSKADWTKHLRRLETSDLFEEDDPAFYGKYSLLSTDQGIRGYLMTVNDLCFMNADALKLESWTWDVVASKKPNNTAATDEASVDAALKSLDTEPVSKFVQGICHGLKDYDWRTSATPELDSTVRLNQAVFRGSSGYREMRERLLTHLGSASGDVAKAAKGVSKALGFQ